MLKDLPQKLTIYMTTNNSGSGTVNNNVSIVDVNPYAGYSFYGNQNQIIFPKVDLEKNVFKKDIESNLTNLIDEEKV